MTNPYQPRFIPLPLPTHHLPPGPARSQREKYGTLFYLGIAGLVVLVALVGWFGYRAWSMRDVWSNIYILHDASVPEEKRVQAAFTLSRDPRVEQNQLWDLSLNRRLPELARYLLAEGIGPELVAQDPQGYASAVTLSPDWPDWLRLVLVRPLAYAATRGHSLSRERLGELCRRSTETRSFGSGLSTPWPSRPGPTRRPWSRSSVLRRPRDPSVSWPNSSWPRFDSDEAHRLEILDRATAWNRQHHPDTIRLWQGWTFRDGKLVRS